ncbi:MAG: carboxymuconolactone decarboxylase family protein [Promethearchaeota archaeon]|nr:MAG: carboxymuconolactone decarboxylase family protein [Candidatus Lokiarchaeota archaeon]
MNKTDASIDLLIQSPTKSFSLHKFKKRSLNWKTFQKLVYQIIMSMKTMGKVSGLSKEFLERIMLAVTSVNECRYCTYYHTKIALESGCSDDEIRGILGGDFSCAVQEELPALAFAQHFAESHEQPSRKALKQLVKVYGIEKSQQIITACRMITMGNLFGNTLDAYIHRYHGISPEDGSPLLEGIVYYIAAIPATKMEKVLKRN